MTCERCAPGLACRSRPSPRASASPSTRYGNMKAGAAFQPARCDPYCASSPTSPTPLPAPSPPAHDNGVAQPDTLTIDRHGCPTPSQPRHSLHYFRHETCLKPIRNRRATIAAACSVV
jgi:hypothetical protein